MMQWRATINGLAWEHIPNACWSVEFGGRRASIVRVPPDEAMVTLTRWTFGTEQMDETKRRIIRFLGAAEE